MAEPNEVVAAIAPEPGSTVLVTVPEPHDPDHLHAIHEGLVRHFPGVQFVLLAGAPTVTEDTLAQWLAWRFGKHATTADDWAFMSEEDRAYWTHEAAAVRRAVMRGGFKREGIDGE